MKTAENSKQVMQRGFKVNAATVEAWLQLDKLNICPIGGELKRAEHFMCPNCFTRAEAQQPGLGAKLTAEIKEIFHHLVEDAKETAGRSKKPVVTDVATMQKFAVEYLVVNQNCSLDELIKQLTHKFGPNSAELVAARAIREQGNKFQSASFKCWLASPGNSVCFLPAQEVVKIYHQSLEQPGTVDLVALSEVVTEVLKQMNKTGEMKNILFPHHERAAQAWLEENPEEILPHIAASAIMGRAGNELLNFSMTNAAYVQAVRARKLQRIAQNGVEEERQRIAAEVDQKQKFFAPYLELARANNLKMNSHQLADQIIDAHPEQDLQKKVLIAAIMTIRSEEAEQATETPFHAQTPNAHKARVNHPGSAQRKAKEKRPVHQTTPTTGKKGEKGKQQGKKHK